MVSLENIHTVNSVQSEQAIFRTIYAYTQVPVTAINEKKRL